MNNIANTQWAFCKIPDDIKVESEKEGEGIEEKEKVEMWQYLAADAFTDQPVVNHGTYTKLRGRIIYQNSLVQCYDNFNCTLIT